MYWVGVILIVAVNIDDATYSGTLNGINFVFFLTARPISSALTLAYASYCQEDGYNLLGLF